MNVLLAQRQEERAQKALRGKKPPDLYAFQQAAARARARLGR